MLISLEEADKSITILQYEKNYLEKSYGFNEYGEVQAVQEVQEVDEEEEIRSDLQSSIPSPVLALLLQRYGVVCKELVYLQERRENAYKYIKLVEWGG